MDAAMVIIIARGTFPIVTFFPRMTAQKSPNVHLQLSVCVMISVSDFKMFVIPSRISSCCLLFLWGGFIPEDVQCIIADWFCPC